MSDVPSTGAARRAAVCGRPVAHSLSPVIHNAGYRAAGLSGWRYEAREIDEDGLAAFLAGLDAGWAGLSLTMPLKRVAAELADEVAPTAALLGVANTLVLSGGRRRADNTDAPGLLDALREAGVEHAGAVAVLGAGGTARAALWAAAALGADRVDVYARRPEAVTALGDLGDRLGVRLRRVDFGRPEPAAAAELVVSTVPGAGLDAFAGGVDWRADAVVFDVLYAPWPTRLAAAASAAGARVLDGTRLLLAQAVRQFELFTGRPAPVPAMRAALHAAVGTADATR